MVRLRVQRALHWTRLSCKRSVSNQVRLGLSRAVHPPRTPHPLLHKYRDTTGADGAGAGRSTESRLNEKMRRAVEKAWIFREEKD